MSFFILYLLIHGPVMAASLGSFSGGMLIAITLAAGFVLLALGITADVRRSTMPELASQPFNAGIIKWIKRLFLTMLIVFMVSKAVPDQRSLAIIVGGGITYEVITSETGKRIGNAAASALENKINEILSKPETPEVKAEGKET